MARKEQNTTLGHVGTFRVRNRDGSETEFRAKTKGILANGATQIAEEKPAAKSEPKPRAVV